MTFNSEVSLSPQQDQAARGELEGFLNQANDAFDLDVIRSQQRELVDQIKQGFTWDTPERFAAEQATGVTQFADAIVEGVRSSELGSVHEHLSELRMVTKRLNEKLEPKGFLSRFFFKARKALEQFATDWDSVDGQINQVIAVLERDRRESLLSIERLRELGSEAVGNFRRMSAAILAGQELLAEERKRLEDLHAEVEKSGDNVQAAELRQLDQRADVFDRRLTNLEKSRGIAAGMIPTIQQTLFSEIIVSEELDMALTQAIPLMKQQLAVVAEQVRQEQRLESLSATRATTDKMMDEIADRLETNQQKVDEQVREGIASADQVVAFLGRIGDTIESIDQRQADAQRDRAAARDRLQSAVGDLRDRLLAKDQ
jgi:uncharacterized protein YaaN involved in tellurite resistance